MTRLTLAASLALLLATACSSDNNNNPPKPALLATQIDREARPAINTAVTAPFDDTATHDAREDVYNADTAPAGWVGNFSAQFQGNLGILDSLDGNCGNQLLAGGSELAGAYKPLADLLANDLLFLRTDSTTCAQYLGVEANFVGVTNDDCGGRTLTEDVIDTSYSLLAAGALMGVTDGIDGTDTAGRVSATFPFLGAPQ